MQRIEAIESEKGMLEVIGLRNGFATLNAIAVSTY